MRIVLDANVLVSGLLTRAGPPGQILDMWLDGKFQLFVSPRILDELQRVLRYPRISERLSEEQTNRFLDKLSKDAELVEGAMEIDVLTRDPSDNMYLACAVKAQAQYLITGNSGHFEEAGMQYRGVTIISPRAFLDTHALDRQ